MSATVTVPVRHFAATDHVEGRARAWVYAARVAKPLAIGWAALAVLALTSALIGPDPLTWLVWAVPVTYLALTAWVVFDLRRQPAEFVITEGLIGTRSLWEAATPELPFTYAQAMSGRRAGASLYVPVGHTVYRLDAERWPELDALETTLRAAARSNATPA